MRGTGAGHQAPPGLVAVGAALGERGAHYALKAEDVDVQPARVDVSRLRVALGSSGVAVAAPQWPANLSKPGGIAAAHGPGDTRGWKRRTTARLLFQLDTRPPRRHSKLPQREPRAPGTGAGGAPLAPGPARQCPRGPASRDQDSAFPTGRSERDARGRRTRNAHPLQPGWNKSSPRGDSPTPYFSCSVGIHMATGGSGVFGLYNPRAPSPSHNNAQLLRRGCSSRARRLRAGLLALERGCAPGAREAGVDTAPPRLRRPPLSWQRLLTVLQRAPGDPAAQSLF